jgi:hypothetical protein
MPKFPKNTGYKMKGYTYPGESPLKIASVSGAQLVKSVGKTYDKYVNYGKIVGDELKKGLDKAKNPMAEEEENGNGAPEEEKEGKDNPELLAEDHSLGDLSGGTGGLGTKKSGGLGTKKSGGFDSPSLSN